RVVAGPGHVVAGLGQRLDHPGEFAPGLIEDGAGLATEGRVDRCLDHPGGCRDSPQVPAEGPPRVSAATQRVLIRVREVAPDTILKPMDFDGQSDGHVRWPPWSAG